MIKVYFKTQDGIREDQFHSIDMAQKIADAQGWQVVRAKRMNDKKRRAIK